MKKRAISEIGANRTSPQRISPFFHALLAVWVAAMLLLGTFAPDAFRALLQEDRIVEWGTVWLFLAAGLLGLRNALRHKRVFDGLVGLFCLFVAGEEFSWGQRLTGFYPPEYFLANNFQQELNLHNLPQWAIQPKWFLIAILATYGLLLPAVFRRPRQNWLSGLIVRLGVSAPPSYLLPWFMTAISLLLWYPHTFTGEWVEPLAGALFIASTRPRSKPLWIALVLAPVFGAVMTGTSGALERGRDIARVTCANAETGSLLRDVALGEASTPELWRYRRVHKRIWTALDEGYLTANRLSPFEPAACEGAAAQSIAVRQKYGIDPWGTPYWILTEKGNAGREIVAVYSFGPNRRRDGRFEEDELAAGDDIAAVSTQRQTP